MNTFPQKTLLAVALASISSIAMSHGYVSESGSGVASSRVALCRYSAPDTNEKNIQCGAIEYEPQSVEGPDGFPNSGPADGHIASAGRSIATALDEQTSDRWVKRPIQSGLQTFAWTFTAPHVTKDWKYYITKPNWNPNQTLSRSSFDLNPFCVIDGHMQRPPSSAQHQCDVPTREGYHVILAVWDVGDTAKSFYNVIDVQFSGDNPGNPNPDWINTGQITPAQNLSVGDRVFTRVFDHSGENAALSTVFKIDEQHTQANDWSYALARKINRTQSNMKAGQLNENTGDFSPTYGINPIYRSKNSNIERVEIGYDIAEGPEYDLQVTGLKEEYVIGNQPTEIDLSLEAKGDLKVRLNVFNHDGEKLASFRTKIKDGRVKNTTLTLSKSKAGHHMLKTRITDMDGNFISQDIKDFFLVDEPTTTPPSGDYDFVFPEGFTNYQAGTKVLAKDDAIYQCKPFPYSGYCSQWSPTATQFEPSIGSDWQTAWDKLDH
ncbi:N-acetylglucosamine-binding protein GbpA [Vibrio aestuarianus]|uniref:N-acetylglucosamine-binding protein GbpA n=1 Tax=Vibrio aestuarianus TaxID=28171 RepID=UPI00237C6BB2|nr:N-acetylglucosamine-binding protein GbpA [Vibrio aestuarianus]MDE1329713.1 N-acetylglucosamine-binding protein GbpA [Vibrio aestuarianus]